MNKLKFCASTIGFVALLALAVSSPQAEARSDGYKRHGYGHHHHPRRWHGPRYHAPPRHYYGPRYRRGPHISLGFVAATLPLGYMSLAVGGSPYYYHGGYFYRPAPSGYVVVSAPLGASVVSLPASAVRVQIGGAVYYQYADAYYQWHPANRAYVVVPAPAAAPATVTVPAPAPASDWSGGYAPGQVVEELPTGYAAEIINGVQYYRYGGDYFLPTRQDGREVYVVVRI